MLQPGHPRLLRGAGPNSGYLLQDKAAAIVIVVSSAVIYTVPVEIGVAVFLFEALLVGTIYQSRGILYPMGWFPPAYCAYSVTFAILALLYPAELSYDLDDYMIVVQMGLVGFWAAQLFNRQRERLIRFPSAASLELIAIWILTGIAIVSLYYLQGLDVANKRQLNEAASIVLGLFLVLSLFSVHMIALQTSRGELNWKLIGIIYAVLTLAYLISGERDLLFRVVLPHIFLFYTYNRRYSYRSYKIFLLFVAAAIVMPASQMMKGIFLFNEDGLSSWSLYEILKGEFTAAGKNLNVIMSGVVPPMHGETLIWDVKRVLSFIYTDQMSPAEWYNVYVRAWLGIEGTSGWGFSLLAEGYMNFGTAGAFAWMFAVGLAARAFHRLSNRSSIWFSIYLCQIPIMIYCLRADLANLANLTIKVNLLVFTIIWLIQRFTPSKRVYNKALAGGQTGL